MSDDLWSDFLDMGSPGNGGGEGLLVETPITLASALEGPTGVDTSTLLAAVPAVTDNWGSVSSGGLVAASTSNWLSSLLNTAAQVLAGKKQVSYSQASGLKVTPTTTQLTPNTMLIVGGVVLVAFVLLMKS